MRAGFVSDTHGDPLAWSKATELFGDADLVFHAGDVLYHGAFNPVIDSYDPRELARLMNGYEVPVLHARGNCDSEVDQAALDNHMLSDFAAAMVGGLRILVTHGHKIPRDELVRMCRRWKVDVLHRGHTHVPELVWEGNLLLVNAGSASLPKQEGGLPTAALLEGGAVTIYDLDSGEPLSREKLRGN